MFLLLIVGIYFLVVLAIKESIGLILGVQEVKSLLIRCFCGVLISWIEGISWEAV